jgi:hypothetical protein
MSQSYILKDIHYDKCEYFNNYKNNSEIFNIYDDPLLCTIFNHTLVIKILDSFITNNYDFIDCNNICEVKNIYIHLCCIEGDICNIVNNKIFNKINNNKLSSFYEYINEIKVFNKTFMMNESFTKKILGKTCYNIISDRFFYDCYIYSSNNNNNNNFYFSVSIDRNDDNLFNFLKDKKLSKIKYLLFTYKYYDEYEYNYNDIFMNEEICCNMYNLIQLSLDGKSIGEYHKDVFKYMINLKKLNIGYNYNKKLDPTIFDSLINLEYLRLGKYYNHILDKNIFSKLSKLKVLILSNNYDYELDKNIFNNLSKLESLDLGKCFNKTLDKDIFMKLVNLKSLKLSNDFNQELDKNVFSKLVNLEHLFFGSNFDKVLDKDIFQNMTNIKYIYFNDNYKHVLDKDIFKNNKSLVKIIVNKNKNKKYDNEFIFKKLPLHIMKIIDIRDSYN